MRGANTSALARYTARATEAEARGGELTETGRAMAETAGGYSTAHLAASVGELGDALYYTGRAQRALAESQALGGPLDRARARLARAETEARKAAASYTADDDEAAATAARELSDRAASLGRELTLAAVTYGDEADREAMRSRYAAATGDDDRDAWLSAALLVAARELVETARAARILYHNGPRS